MVKRLPAFRDLKREFARAADPKRARGLAWFFKTGKGEYGEGDKFIGLTVPVQRAIAKKFRHLKLGDVEKLLNSSVHEHRSTGLMILVAQYEAGDHGTKQKIFDFYMKHSRRINNWDLVDGSAPYIVGRHLADAVASCTVSLGKIARSLGTSHCDGRDCCIHPRQRPQGNFRHCGSATLRQARSDPQSNRLDAARSRKAIAATNDRLFEAQLFADAAHRAALRHRALIRSSKEAGSQRYLHLVREHRWFERLAITL